MVNLRNGGDSRFASATSYTLLDGDSWRQAADEINIWFFELLHELPRIRRHAVEKPALSLGEQDVERYRRFAGAAQPCYDHQLFPRDFQIDVLKVVLSRALNVDRTVAITRAKSRSCFCGSRQLYAVILSVGEGPLRLAQDFVRSLAVFAARDDMQRFGKFRENVSQESPGV